MEHGLQARQTIGEQMPWYSMTMDYTEKVCDLIPEELWGWRPADPQGHFQASLGEIAMHCADERMEHAQFLNGITDKSGFYALSPDRDGMHLFKKGARKEDVLARLKIGRGLLDRFAQHPAERLTEVTEAARLAHERQVAALTDQGIDTTQIESRGAPSIFRVLMAVACHEAGHRGTLYTLLRMNGVSLPNTATRWRSSCKPARVRVKVKQMSQPETEDGSVDLLCFFKALADETRLKMAALLSRESRSSEELANLLGIKPATVSRHLSKLADSGLVTSTSKGHRPVYSLQFGGVRATAGRLLAKDRGIQVPDTDDTSDYDRKVLKDFFRSDGSLQQIPMQRKKFLVVLKQLLKGIEPAREYPEKELNAILAQHHADTATLRRGLIDYGLMNRRSGVYWRV